MKGSRLDLAEGHHVAVLDRVVQQAGHDRHGVHAQSGQDERHLHRVCDEGLPALALLASVALVGQRKGSLHLRLQGDQRCESGASLSNEEPDRSLAELTCSAGGR